MAANIESFDRLRSRSIIYHLLASLSGLGWGLLVWLVIFEGIGPHLVGGVIISPIIGFGIGMATRRWYRLNLLLRIALALVSLYAAAVLFGLAVGVHDWLFSDMTNRIWHAVILQTILMFLWGLSLTGYLLVLGPLAYLNHWLMGLISPDRLAEKSRVEPESPQSGLAEP